MYRRFFKRFINISASAGSLMVLALPLGIVSLWLELADKGIRVNCICPAMVCTELVKRDQELTGVDYSEKEKDYPLKRFGQPNDIDSLAVYLLSDASSWVTGSCFDITGRGEFTLKA